MVYLRNESKFPYPEIYRGNIENFIGMSCVPTGIVGPVNIKGTMAQGDFFVPLSTIEGGFNCII